MAKRVLLVDDNITNSDWVKANAFDFPGVETVEDFERVLDVPVSEPARTMRLEALAKLPWAKVTPEPIYELLFPYATANKSLIDLIKASFGGDRSAAGRYAANMRWKGHQKDDVFNKVTISHFTSDEENSGTVWATDKATGKVIGALQFDGHFVRKVYVLPDYRRKGVASLLYVEAKKHNGDVEMRADDYTNSGASFMSAATGKEIYQSGDYSTIPPETVKDWRSWLNKLEAKASNKRLLIDLIKASFGGDRSAAGRYAAEQRWKGNRKKDKPKTERKKKQPDYLDPRLGKAIEILANNFTNDAIAVLRQASSDIPKSTAEEIRLAVVTEEVGRLIDAVIGEELKKLEDSLAPQREVFRDDLIKLQAEVRDGNDRESRFVSGFFEVTEAQYGSVMDQVTEALPPITRPVSSPIRVILERETIQKAVSSAQKRIISLFVSGELKYEKLFKLSDSELLVFADDKTLSSDFNQAVYEKADREAAFLSVMRRQIGGGFGRYIGFASTQLGPAEERNKARNDLVALSTKMNSLTVSVGQRQEITKSVLSKLGVKFGEAGQVPVELQYKKTDEVVGRKVTSSRDAKETPMGRKFQSLIDEAVQLLPATLLKGSINSTVQPSCLYTSSVDAKYPVRVALYIRNGRAHAQKIVELQDPGYPSSQKAKLKLNSLKLNQTASEKWKSTALHEMGHAAEFSNSWLTQMQSAYWTHRAKGELPSSLKKLTGLRYKSYEKGVKDAWGEIYAGKNYQYKNPRTNSWEIFTTGLEGIFYGGKADPDHRAFTLGLLALSTQIRD